MFFFFALVSIRRLKWSVEHGAHGACFDSVTSQWKSGIIQPSDTVDGRNPGPPGIYKALVITG